MNEYTLEELEKGIDTIVTFFARWEPGVTNGHRVHLAILQEPYLSLILDGTKTIESRFSQKRIAPFKKAKPGDIILLKRSSGSVEGICKVNRSWFFEMNPGVVKRLREEFYEQLCIDDQAYWKNKIEPSSYGSLLEVSNVVRVDHFKVTKKDRRPWVIIKDEHDLTKERGLTLLDFNKI